MFNHLFPLRLPRAAVVILLSGLAFLTGCGVEYEQDAAELADRVYERIEEGDFEGASNLYSDRFYERVPRDRWLDTLRQIRDDLGPYESHSLMEGREQTYGPEEDPGEVFTVLMYRVEYAEDDAVEQLTFSRSTPQIALVNHQLMSDAVAVNFDDAENPVQVASASTRETGTEPAEEPEAAPEPQEESAESPGETVQRDVPPEPAAETIEEQIAAEVLRLRSATKDPEAEQLVGQLVINGIHPGRNRILVESRLVKQGEPVRRGQSVVLQAVEPRRIVFRDDTGAVYEKAFLASEP